MRQTHLFVTYEYEKSHLPPFFHSYYINVLFFDLHTLRNDTLDICICTGNRILYIIPAVLSIAFRIFILSEKYKKYNKLQCGMIEIYIVTSKEIYTESINPILWKNNTMEYLIWFLVSIYLNSTFVIFIWLKFPLILNEKSVTLNYTN